MGTQQALPKFNPNFKRQLTHKGGILLNRDLLHNIILDVFKDV